MTRKGFRTFKFNVQDRARTISAQTVYDGTTLLPSFLLLSSVSLPYLLTCGEDVTVSSLAAICRIPSQQQSEETVQRARTGCTSEYTPIRDSYCKTDHPTLQKAPHIFTLSKPHQEVQSPLHLDWLISAFPLGIISNIFHYVLLTKQSFPTEWWRTQEYAVTRGQEN